MSKIDEILKRHNRDNGAEINTVVCSVADKEVIEQIHSDRAYLLGLIDRIEAKCEQYRPEAVVHDNGTRVRVGSLATAGKLSTEIREIINEQ